MWGLSCVLGQVWRWQGSRGRCPTALLMLHWPVAKLVLTPCIYSGLTCGSCHRQFHVGCEKKSQYERQSTGSV